MKARCRKELIFDGFKFEVDKEYDFEQRIVYLPAEESKVVLARGNRSRHIQYSTKIETTWNIFLHRTEKVPMTVYFYDHQYCVNRDWQAKGIGPLNVNGGELLCFEEWFIESEPEQIMKRLRTLGQIPSPEEFQRELMCDPLDSVRLREHLNATPIDIKRIEGIVPTIIIK